jgi:hypothetical protein
LNNTKEFELLVTSSTAIVVRGNNAGAGTVGRLESSLREKGVRVETIDANDAKLASATNATIYVVGEVENTGLLTKAVENGNMLAIADGQNEVQTIAKADKIFQVERVRDYDVNTATIGLPVKMIEKLEPVATKPVAQFEYKSKKDLVNLTAPNLPSDYKVKMVAPSEKVIRATEEAYSNVIPAVKSSPFGELKLIRDDEMGVFYVIPSIQKSNPGSGSFNASSFSLEQNYPNPFNPSTSISYTMPVSGQVTIKVLDLLGKEVATLVNDQKSAGTYTIYFNGVDASGAPVASGTYMYRMDVTSAKGETFTSTRKMILSK